jgi:hypothetical protein
MNIINSIIQNQTDIYIYKDLATKKWYLIVNQKQTLKNELEKILFI